MSSKRLGAPLRRAAAVGLVLLSGGLLACGDDGDSGPATSSGQGGSAGNGGTAGAAGVGGAGVGGAGGGGEGGSGGQGGCNDSLPLPEEVPELLSETGLYADITSKQLNAAVLPFAPQYQLWSDSADKQRWVYLPECDVIDTSDMNDWVLPVGTRLWKEFALNGVRIETRLIMRTGPGDNDFEYTTYLWNSAETEATRTNAGVLDAKGTTHDVPGEAACRQCHGSHAKGGGRPSRALGLSALQLSGDGAPLSLQALADAGKLSVPPSVERYPTVGADATEQAALGYLHANCGHCHNHTADGVPQIDMNLWIDVEAESAAETGAYMTAVGVANAIFNDPHVSARIEPGNPQASSIWYRMNQRGNNGQMPPIASEFVDPVGAAAVEAWIGALQ